MAYLTVAEVQTWIEESKLTIEAVDSGLESVANSKVMTRLSAVYDTSSWLDEASTPLLVRQVMAMFVAAWYYRRQYSEDTDATPSYADWLEGLANSLLDDLANLVVTIPGVAVIAGVDSGPDFYPRDTNYDEYGRVTDEPAFRMSMGF